MGRTRTNAKRLKSQKDLKKQKEYKSAKKLVT